MVPAAGRRARLAAVLWRAQQVAALRELLPLLRRTLVLATVLQTRLAATRGALLAVVRWAVSAQG